MRKPKYYRRAYDGNKLNGDRRTNFVAAAPRQQQNIKAIKSHVARRKFISLRINQQLVKLQLDTAADITIISKSNWIKVGKPKLQRCMQKVSDASNNKIPVVGEFQTKLQHNNIERQATICVTKLENLNIFGTDLIEKFGYWDCSLAHVCQQISLVTNKNTILDEIHKHMPAVIQDKTGHCTRFALTLYTKPNSTPVFKAKRPVPFATLPLVEAELNRLEAEGIITPVTHSEWAAPIVVVRKANNKIRICGDYSTGLNQCMEPNLYPIPHADEIFAKMAKCKVFSKIDLSDAYLQFEVDEASKKLLTITTHKGLYLFNRLPPGITSAPGAFQKAMDTILSGLDGVMAYLDDVIIATTTVEQNSTKLREVIKRFHNHGLTIRWEKCDVFQTSIKYLGHVIDSRGIHPDPKKVEAVSNMPRPQNVSQLRSFLGAINYYGKFISRMRDLRHPLDNLLKAESKWTWDEKCESSFQKFKQMLQSNLFLTHYDSKLPIFVAADASMVGIGAQIFHEMPDGTRKAIYHVSRALTSSEQKYSQIEKEALAIVFACVKFHRMIYGRKFVLLTDHKPLLTIFGSKRGIPTHTANRLQRWALILMCYNFRIQYVNTNEFGNVDILSRLIGTQTSDEDFVVAAVTAQNDLNFIIEDSIKHLPVTQNMIKAATSKDTELPEVAKCIEEGWPHASKITCHIKPYYNRRETLSIVNNCIMSGDRVVIPAVFRRRILKQLHKGHQGIERMKSLSRSYVYWPNIDADIAQYVRQCQNCAVVMNSPTKSLLNSWPIPKRVLERVHIDIAGPLRGKYYFVIVDSYSKWPEVTQTSTITSNEITKHMHEFISRYGQPRLIVSDNGTQFTSSIFQKICEERGITHLTTPAYHPQSNGQAERFVETIKRALEKSYCDAKPDDKENLLTFLLQYRATPNPNAPDGKSPSELFIGRRIHTELDLLKTTPEVNNVRNSIMENFYNKKHGARARSFQAGDKIYAKVYYKNKMSWVPGEVVERVGGVIYGILVSTDRRNTFIRSHINQLRHRYGNDLKPPITNDAVFYEQSSDLQANADGTNLPSTTMESTQAETQMSPQEPDAEAPVLDNDSAMPRRSSRRRYAPRRYSPS